MIACLLKCSLVVLRPCHSGELFLGFLLISFWFLELRAHGPLLPENNVNIYSKCNYVKTIDKENMLIDLHSFMQLKVCFFCLQEACTHFSEFIVKNK